MIRLEFGGFGQSQRLVPRTFPQPVSLHDVLTNLVSSLGFHCNPSWLQSPTNSLTSYYAQMNALKLQSHAFGLINGRLSLQPVQQGAPKGRKDNHEKSFQMKDNRENKGSVDMQMVSLHKAKKGKKANWQATIRERGNEKIGSAHATLAQQTR